MKAVIYENYGLPEVLKIKEVEKPILKKNEMLVKVKASSVTAGSLWIRSGNYPSSIFFTLMLRLMFGLRKPKKPILGYEFAGEIESIGAGVKNFSVGDKVFGTTTGLRQGSYAEYLCVPEKWKHGVVHPMPKNLSFEKAAAVPIGGMTAVDILKKANIQKNQKVLIYGASGSVGTYAVQLAKNFGALVTGVCSTANIDLVKSIGAVNVIDYTKVSLSNIDEKYDVIFDAVGKISKKLCKDILNKKGKYLTVKSVTSEKQEYMIYLKELIESKKIKPIIDTVYPMDKIVSAHMYVEKGHKKGNVVIKID